MLTASEPSSFILLILVGGVFYLILFTPGHKNASQRGAVIRRSILSPLPRSYLARRLPPGPPGLPFVQNLFDMPSKKPWVTVVEWAKKYGAPDANHCIVELQLPLIQPSQAMLFTSVPPVNISSISTPSTQRLTCSKSDHRCTAIAFTPLCLSCESNIPPILVCSPTFH